MSCLQVTLEAPPINDAVYIMLAIAMIKKIELRDIANIVTQHGVTLHQQRSRSS